MNCAYCEERLSDYLEDALGVGERAAVELHFESCSACAGLREGVREVMQWSRAYPAYTTPEWLATRIVANTPRVVRVSFADWLAAAWRSVSEPRFATALLTSTLVLGWMGNIAGFKPADVTLIAQPTAVYEGVQGWISRAYGDVVRGYYSSPIVNEIQCQIHSRIEQFRENS